MRAIRFNDESKKGLKALRKESSSLAAKLWDFILNIDDTPYDGLGHPKPLKGDLSGAYSRELDRKHRLVYRVTDNTIEILGCYGHYGDH